MIQHAKHTPVEYLTGKQCGVTSDNFSSLVKETNNLYTIITSITKDATVLDERIEKNKCSIEKMKEDNVEEVKQTRLNCYEQVHEIKEEVNRKFEKLVKCAEEREIIFSNVSNEMSILKKECSNIRSAHMDISNQINECHVKIDKILKMKLRIQEEIERIRDDMRIEKEFNNYQTNSRIHTFSFNSIEEAKLYLEMSIKEGVENLHTKVKDRDIIEEVQQKMKNLYVGEREGFYQIMV
tara:strand:+ start:6710 stop:7423 length:714 start_codon:yes stop_codon:yes gene_type:complete